MVARRNRFRKVIARSQSRGSGLQLSLLRMAVLLTKPPTFRGLGKFAQSISRMGFDETNFAVVSIHEHGLLKIYLNDYYWIRILASDFEYEPEVAALLKALLGPDLTFLDCGANIGYWSVLAANRIQYPARVLAIEAGPSTFQRLRQNASLNGDAFHSFHAAVSDNPGELIDFIDNLEHHASAKIIKGSSGAAELSRTAKVRTTSIDEMIESRLDCKLPGGIIIKLDVEGNEVRALQGARKTLGLHDCIIIYEDHGGDLSCAPTEFLLNELGLHCYSLWPIPRRIHSVREALAIKRDPRKGYNFLAVQADGHMAQVCESIIRAWALE